MCPGYFIKFPCALPQHVASADLQSPQFIPHTHTDATWLILGQPRVSEILATLSSSVEMDGI